ncbi:MAG: hypothetical protein LBJ63_03185 [Prevotellaceae bacterium]|jgi:hypothetical protein|nr:hypothetical protein [Prevotellaceae bacterium]
MKNDRYIFNIKRLLFAVIAMVFCCVSCVKDEFDSKIALQEDVVIANEIEAVIKTIGVISKEVEDISDRLKIGIAIGVIVNEEENKWESVFDTYLLSGKIAVEYLEQNTNSNEMKNVDCSGLKIQYYKNIWMQLFGSFTMENMNSVSNQGKKYGIHTEDFGYTDTSLSSVPDIVVNSDYVIDYNFARENVPAQMIFSGSGYGYNKLSGNYKHTITENIKTDIKTFNIVDGKIIIIIDKYGEKFPVEIEYSQSGRTVKYRGNEQTTYYSNI